MLTSEEVITTLSSLFTNFLGDVPAEFEGFIYLFYVMLLFFIVDCLFQLLKELFRL